MEDTTFKPELLITSLANRRGRGKNPAFFCGNCKCTRYLPCRCALNKVNAAAELSRIKGKK